MEIAMILADGGAKGMAGPAFPAHIATMGHWSMAIWERWLPVRHLQLAIADTKVRLVQAARPWQRVFGPAAAFIASAARLNWRVLGAENCTTDLGMEAEPRRRPPCSDQMGGAGICAEMALAEPLVTACFAWHWQEGAYAVPSAYMEALELEVGVRDLGGSSACWAQIRTDQPAVDAAAVPQGRLRSWASQVPFLRPSRKPRSAR